MMLREYQPYLWLTLLAAISAWLVSLTEFKESAVLIAAKHSADYFSNNYSKMEMDAEGKPKNFLRAAKMVHYSDDGTTELEAPQMTFYNDDEPPWEVTSETAQLSADGKDLHMNGKALIERAAAPGIRMLKINTSDLKVNPETSYAESDAWSELISPPDVTSGIGMKATFKKPVHLKLLAKVKGRYEVK
jgi:lipopolysaccharide export system protein LptC